MNLLDWIGLDWSDFTQYIEGVKWLQPGIQWMSTSMSFLIQVDVGDTRRLMIQ